MVHNTGIKSIGSLTLLLRLEPTDQPYFLRNFVSLRLEVRFNYLLRMHSKYMYLATCLIVDLRCADPSE